MFSIDNMTKIESYVENVQKKATEMQYLSKYIAGSLVPIYDQKTYFDEIYKYNVTFNSDLDIKFKL